MIELVHLSDENIWLQDNESLSLVSEYQYGVHSKSKVLKNIKWALFIYIGVIILVTFERVFYLTVRNSNGIVDFLLTGTGILALIFYFIFIVFFGWKIQRELLKRSNVLHNSTKLSLYMKGQAYYLTHYSFELLKFSVLKIDIPYPSIKFQLFQDNYEIGIFYHNTNGEKKEVLRLSDLDNDNFVELAYSHLRGMEIIL